MEELPGSDGKKSGPSEQLGILKITGDHSVPKYFQLLRTSSRICTFYVLGYDIAGNSPLVQVSCFPSLNYYIGFFLDVTSQSIYLISNFVPICFLLSSILFHLTSSPLLISVAISLPK